MRPLPLLLPLVLLLTSCGNLQNLATKARAKRQQKAMEKLVETSSEEATARLGAHAVGEISYVADAEQYVLVKTLAGATIPESANLESRQNGKRNAILRATSARNKAFIAADILEGNPQSGDPVFPSTAKPATPTGRPTTTTTTTTTPALPNTTGTPGNGTATTGTTGSPPAAPAPPMRPQDLVPPPILPGGFDPANPMPLPPPIESVEDLQRQQGR